MKQIAEGIYYVGVNDRDKERFETLWPLPLGVAYNSYLIVDEKVTLIDTVDSRFFPEYIDKIRQVIGGRAIDYLVINHMEPDHSGSLALVRQVYPDVCLVGNKKTLSMVEGFYGEAGETLAVADGQELSIGETALKFYLTPMVHWPETMMTYHSATKTLFSGDAFGCFGALNGGVRDTELQIESYFPEMLRYYSCIVGKYGAQVQMALKKLAQVPLNRICSTHGPVWETAIDRVFSVYDRLSRYEGERGACLVFASMYGNTTRMAEAVSEGMIQAGMNSLSVHQIGKTDPSYMIADAFHYNTLVLGAPTYNNGLFPAMESYLSALKERGLKNRRVAVFGSFSWASQAVKHLAEFAALPGMTLVGEPVEMKQGFNREVEQRCIELGKQIAGSIGV